MSTQGWDKDPQYQGAEYPPPWSKPSYSGSEPVDSGEVYDWGSNIPDRREDYHPVVKFSAALIVGLMVILVVSALILLIAKVVQAI